MKRTSQRTQTNADDERRDRARLPNTPMSCTSNSARCFHASYAPAQISVGTARKNENSVAARRDRPNSNPPMMVAPERDVPGINANDCAMPIFSASRHVMSSTDFTRTTCLRRSTHRMIKPADDERDRHRHRFEQAPP